MNGAIVRKLFIIFAIFFTLNVNSEPENKIPEFTNPSEFTGSIFHVGFWVEDLGEMLDFLSVFMEYRIVMRANRNDGGERLMIKDKRGQVIELLTDADNVVPHPGFPLHPEGRVAGIAHISFHIADAVKIKDTLVKRGYEIITQVPADFSAGYANDKGRVFRILYVKGPGDLTFELFEIKSN